MVERGDGRPWQSMSDRIETYRSRLCTAAEAAKLVSSGGRVYSQMGAARPADAGRVYLAAVCGGVSFQPYAAIMIWKIRVFGM